MIHVELADWLTIVMQARRAVIHVVDWLTIE